MDMLIITLIAAGGAGVAGSFAYRWRGMNENDVPSLVQNRLVRRILCCLIPAISIAGVTLSFWPLLLAPLMFYGIIVGHGSYFPGKLHHPDAPNKWRNEDNENFAFLTKLISDPLDEKARFVGMALTGLAQTLPVLLIPVIAYFVDGSIVAIAPWYALVGILKAVVYWVCPNTDVSEWAWGAVYCGLAPLAFFDFGFWAYVVTLL